MEQAYEYAVNAGNPDPGGDPAVITDGMILSGVQANWPENPGHRPAEEVVMPTVGQPVPGYYYDQFTDTLRPITGGPGPKGDLGNANVTVSPTRPRWQARRATFGCRPRRHRGPPRHPCRGDHRVETTERWLYQFHQHPDRSDAAFNVALTAGRLYAFNGYFRAISASRHHKRRLLHWSGCQHDDELYR